jgi:hypothetical protein
LHPQNRTVSGPAFSVEVDQNPYLPAGGRDVSAIVTVTASDSMGDAAGRASPREPGDGGRAGVITAELMRGAMSKQLPGVLLRVWTPQQAALKFVKQVAPSVDDLTARRAPSGPRAGDYPTGAWAPGESRDYHVSIQVQPAFTGQEMLAARVSLVAGSASGERVLGTGLIRVTWTDDEALSARINPRVASYTGQAELASAIQEGLEARQRGDEDTATARLGRAVVLAHETGNEDVARLLATVLDVLDASTGTVRLKKRVDSADEMALDTRSTKTVRVSKGDGRQSGGGDSVRPRPQADPGTGQARNAPPPDSSTGEGSVPGSPRPGERPPPHSARFLVAQLPARVPASAEVSLMVRISASPRAAEAAGSAPLAGLTVGPGGTRVTVVVQAPSGLVPLTALQRVMTVPETGDPPPVRFEFLARVAGLHRMVITAWAGGTFLAELGLELSVDESGRYADAPARMTPVGAVRPRAGEVTLQVRSDGQRYTFQFLSEPYLFEPVPAEALTAHPSAAVERTVATLRSVAQGSSGYSGGNARAWMEQAGVGLWNDMVPGLIKEQFWQLRDHIGAFSIAAGDDVIPWELLYPLAAGHDEGFLVEQFPVMRRVYGQQRSRSLLIAGTRYVMPARSPANAQAEIASVRRVLSEAGEPAEMIADLEDLLRFIESGNCGSLHFACHNTFSSDAGGSAITMSGGPFVPMLLNKAVTRRVLAGQDPLIFINACRSAGAVPEYTRMMGWAQQFMAAGAGAFVGTLWAVSSTAAQIFAEAFYSALAAGNSLGEASRHARAETGRDHDDPTWLAYSVYGDPAAQAITTATE